MDKASFLSLLPTATWKCRTYQPWAQQLVDTVPTWAKGPFPCIPTIRYSQLALYSAIDSVKCPNIIVRY